jgi:hypothetical protein
MAARFPDALRIVSFRVSCLFAESSFLSRCMISLFDPSGLMPSIRHRGRKRWIGVFIKSISIESRFFDVIDDDDPGFSSFAAFVGALVGLREAFMGFWEALVGFREPVLTAVLSAAFWTASSTCFAAAASLPDLLGIFKTKRVGNEMKREGMKEILSLVSLLPRDKYDHLPIQFTIGIFIHPDYALSNPNEQFILKNSLHQAIARIQHFSS